MTGEAVAVTALTAVHLDTEARKATAFAADVKERAAARAIEFTLPGET